VTTRETALVMAVLQSAYPAFYRGQSQQDMENAVRLWREMFADDAFQDVMAAVKALIATKTEGYPPTIGAVKERLAQVRFAGEMDAQEAWALAAKAAAGSIKWDKLPEAVQNAIGSPSVLRDWGAMDADTFNSVVYSQFVKAYRIKQQRAHELSSLPSDVRNLLTAMADNRALEAARPERKSLHEWREAVLTDGN